MKNQHKVCGACGRAFATYCAFCAAVDDVDGGVDPHSDSDPFAGVRAFEDPATAVKRELGPALVAATKRNIERLVCAALDGYDVSAQLREQHEQLALWERSMKGAA